MSPDRSPAPSTFDCWAVLLLVLTTIPACGSGGSSGASPADLARSYAMTINGSIVAVDVDGERFFVSPPRDFLWGSSLVATFEFSASDRLELEIDDVRIKSGDTFVFPEVTSGLEVEVDVMFSSRPETEYRFVFTEIATVEILAPVIVDDPRMLGTLGLSGGGRKKGLPRLTIGIEIRGGFSKRLPKNSYGFDLLNGSLELLGMREDDDWILDGSYIDPTMLRNRVSHDIYLAMRPQAFPGGGQSTVDGRFVEVVLNSRYHGIYVLSERVDRKLLKLSKTTAGSAIYKAVDHAADFRGRQGLRGGFRQKFPEAVVQYWQPLERLVEFVSESSDEKFVEEIAERVLFDSLVDWWIIVLLSSSGDNVTKNYYLGRDGDGPWFLVPWDMDGSFGKEWNGSNKPATDAWPIGANHLIGRLTRLPQSGFNKALQTRWTGLRATALRYQALMSRFEGYALRLTRCGAYERTFDRWGFWGDSGTVEEVLELDELAKWIRGRLDFLDKAIAGLRVR